MDEISLTVVHRTRKVLATCGKQVGKVASGEKGPTVTLICALSASGNHIPPALISNRKRMTDRLLCGSPAGTVGYCSDNRRTNNEVFVQWLHILQYVQTCKAD